MAHPYVGLFVDTHMDKPSASAVFDQVSLTPLPLSTRILPPGVVLQGGSLLAGRVNFLNFDPTDPTSMREFVHGDKVIPIDPSLVAAVITLPLERSRLAELGSKPGILMRNGDFLDAKVQSITGAQVTVSSILLGIQNYNSTDFSACFIKPLQPQPAAYEVRLRDGSILNATAIAGNAAKFEIKGRLRPHTPS